MVPVASQLNPFHIIMSSFLKDYFGSKPVLPSAPRSFKLTLPFICSDYDPVARVLSLTCVLHVSSSRGLHGPALGLVAQIMFGPRPGSGFIHVIAIRHKIEHFGFSRAILFWQRKVIHSCAHLMLLTQSGSGNRSHQLYFLGDFRSCPSQQNFQITF
jgi:hypothetical protein